MNKRNIHNLAKQALKLILIFTFPIYMLIFWINAPDKPDYQFIEKNSGIVTAKYVENRLVGKNSASTDYILVFDNKGVSNVQRDLYYNTNVGDDITVGYNEDVSGYETVKAEKVLLIFLLIVEIGLLIAFYNEIITHYFKRLYNSYQKWLDL